MKTAISPSKGKKIMKASVFSVGFINYSVNASLKPYNLCRKPSGFVNPKFARVVSK